jgi:hypothetical protein
LKTTILASKGCFSRRIFCIFNIVRQLSKQICFQDYKSLGLINNLKLFMYNAN